MKQKQNIFQRLIALAVPNIQPVSNVLSEPVVTDPLYVHINELPFVLFEDCIVNNRLNSLIKVHHNDGIAYKPVVDDVALRERWFKLYSQHCEEIGDPRMLNVTKLSAKIMILDSKINRVENMVSMMREWFVEGHVSQLKADVMGVTIDTSSYESYQKSLDAVLSRTKPMVMERKVLIDEYNNIQKKSSTNKSINYSYFTSRIQEISKYVGYAVKKSDLMTLDYCTHIRTMNEHYSKLTNLKPTK